VGEGSEPGKEAVEFRSRVGIGFPASDIQEVSRAEKKGRAPAMNVNFMGLAGLLGPMPHAITELVLQREWYSDFAFADFLNIFNHRLISLFYRVRRMCRPGFDLKSPESTHFASYLFSLIGLGTIGTRNRMEVNDRALLLYTGILAQKPRSMMGLEAVLSDYFHVKVKGRALVGRWYNLEEDQITAIGITGRNQRLGQTAVAGSRVWNQQGKFGLDIGPLNLEEYMRFLPVGSGYLPLCQLTLFYAGQEFDFDFLLILKAREVPESRLSAKLGPYLGWTSWLKTRDFKRDARVRLGPRRAG
jgi:type VI secretion system protein ImpH